MMDVAVVTARKASAVGAIETSRDKSRDAIEASRDKSRDAIETSRDRSRNGDGDISQTVTTQRFRVTRHLTQKRHLAHMRRGISVSETVTRTYQM